MTASHGYGRYAHGCRCDDCKAAKAAYMRDRRNRAYLADSHQGAPFTHGTRFGYEERGCRCDECYEAERTSVRWENSRPKPRSDRQPVPR